jgi:2-keto-4-pentenoate hydratase/2-oxohepta-3-ene-1,7-dioic acid hydratase in catechol pathway
MRFVTYRSGRGDRAGLLSPGGLGIVDVEELLGEGLVTMREVLQSGALIEDEQQTELSVGNHPATPIDEVELLAPVPDPDKIVCIGLNYRAHAAEANLEPPESPTFFAKFRNALAPPGAEVSLPGASAKVDFEAEVAVIVGRRLSEAGENDALEAVAGYMLFNDLSARDLQFATPQWMPGKVFDGSAPCGPALVTPDEAGPHDRIEFSLTLNGERMQSATTSDLIFPVPVLLAHLSRLMTLEPGDVIATGTPEGAGFSRDPSVWLRPGDEVVISSSTLGELRTAIR